MGKADGPISSLLVSLGLAVIGYISTTLQNLRADQHKSRVARVGEQLKELYGPLLACVHASKARRAAVVTRVHRVEVPHFAIVHAQLPCDGPAVRRNVTSSWRAYRV